MALGHHQDQAQQRVAPDLVEVSSRVPIPEIPGPPAQDAVDVLHDHLDWEQQPAPVGQLPDPVTGMLHRLVRGPAGKEPDLPMTCRFGAHPTMWNPRKSNPSPPSSKCTILVLACLSARPSSARIAVSAASARSASCRVRHTTTASSA